MFLRAEPHTKNPPGTASFVHFDPTTRLGLNSNGPPGLSTLEVYRRGLPPKKCTKKMYPCSRTCVLDDCFNPFGVAFKVFFRGYFFKIDFWVFGWLQIQRFQGTFVGSGTLSREVLKRTYNVALTSTHPGSLL